MFSSYSHSCPRQQNLSNTLGISSTDYVMKEPEHDAVRLIPVERMMFRMQISIEKMR